MLIAYFLSMPRPSKARIKVQIKKMKLALKKEPADFARLQRRIEKEEKKLRSLLKPAKFIESHKRHKEKRRLLSRREKLRRKVA